MTELPLSPSAMVAGGHALARHPDGRVLFVEGALPGDAVLARLVDERRDYGRAVVSSVLEPSPDRVAPPCPAVAAGCGGCTWQHISPEAQPRFKAAIVTDALRRIARLADPPEVTPWPVGAAPSMRTTARLAVSASGRAGHRRTGQADSVVETGSCLAAHPLLEELIVDGRYPGAGEVVLRVGAASGERLVRVDRPEAVNGVRVPPDVVVVGPIEPGAVHESVAGRTFRISADSFFQPGPVAASALVAAVHDAAGDAIVAGGHAVDAYAGVGLFGAVLAADGGMRVTAIENHGAAVGDARVNLTGLAARVVESDVGRWRPRRREGVDVVVADPSRPGLGRPGVTALAAARAPRFVLVSCDPASFARDVRLLETAGYVLHSVRLVDAFPHTFHVETVSRFDLRAPS